MAVNLSAIKDLLLPGLRGVEGKYEMIPSQYDKIFTKHDSKLALERTAEMRFLGLAQLKTVQTRPGCLRPTRLVAWIYSAVVFG